MQIRALRVFCDIASQRSFSRAAAAHGMTQSAASQIVHHLEQDLSVQLIDRSKRPLVLTPAGQLYFEGLQRILYDFQTLEQEVRSFGKRLAGHVEVASIYSVGLSYMPSAKSEFAKRHPDVDLHVEFVIPERVHESVMEGTADLGLISYPKSTRTLNCVTWQREPMKLICAPDHPFASRREVCLADLNGQLMLGFDSSLKVQREIVAYLTRNGIRPKFDTGFDNIDSLIRAIQLNSGIGILPEPAIRREVANDSLRVIQCPDLEITRPLGIIWRRGARLGPAALEFGALLLGRPLKPDESSSELRRRADAELKQLAASAAT
ncbi:HTH-type transcriptional regulator CysL [Rosistilla carotiformis]|uniref:HTH-type transcriptional regulator CysL n=1 Tax=Rosistilla carotiformis TaxID=2528017 RepID=A0A518K0S6_9BACT|nr:LysR family transcriptional regulator [Rosistilla carotiformis]QDV71398.1 HTH-type transcriptional regulator CysL [Rosistilla carotiformis]